MDSSDNTLCIKFLDWRIMISFRMLLLDPISFNPPDIPPEKTLFPSPLINKVLLIAYSGVYVYLTWKKAPAKHTQTVKIYQYQYLRYLKTNSLISTDTGSPTPG